MLYTYEIHFKKILEYIGYEFKYSYNNFKVMNGTQWHIAIKKGCKNIEINKNNQKDKI